MGPNIEIINYVTDIGLGIIIFLNIITGIIYSLIGYRFRRFKNRNNGAAIAVSIERFGLSGIFFWNAYAGINALSVFNPNSFGLWQMIGILLRLGIGVFLIWSIYNMDRQLK